MPTARCTNGRFGKHISVADDDTIVRMRLEGMMVKEIAEATGETPRHIEYRLGKLALTVNQKREVTIGKKYGCWIVLGEAARKKVGKQSASFRQWTIECCNCKWQRNVHSHVLFRDAEQYFCGNCGLLPKGQSGLNALFHKYKKSAEDRDHQFLLKLSQFAFITSCNCLYCGSPHRQFALAILVV